MEKEEPRWFLSVNFFLIGKTIKNLLNKGRKLEEKQD